MFWFEHDVLNGDLNPTPPTLTCCAEGYVMAVERIDDHTVVWRYDVPNPFVGLRLAHADGVNHLHRMQAHYLAPFHADFADKPTLDKAIADAGLDTWVQLYNHMSDHSYGMPQDDARGNLPTLLPMRFASRQDPVRTFDRNPYYWKTDPDGNQLPYIDQVIATNAHNPESADAMIAAGRVNYCPASVATLYSYAFYRQNESAGHYVVRLYNSGVSTDACYQPNHTVADPVLRQLYNDLRFKQALSLAIDRETINQLVYQGLGTPVQTHVVSKSRYHVRSYEQAFVDHDPAAAADLLNQIGLDQTDDEGYRLRPDGRRLTINITFCPREPQHTANAEMVRQMWEALDIHVTLDPIPADALAQRVAANDVAFGIAHPDRYTDLLFPLRPESFVPCALGERCCWGIEWARWFTTNGDAGQQPPNEILNLFDIWNEMKATVDEYDQVFLGRQLLKSQADHLWTIGTVGRLPAPVIAGDNMGNVPETGWTGYDYLDTYPYHSEQFFFRGGSWSNEPE
jgi:peptide/nickel transport system substrate-binding protein